jgi:hypothetical protein
MNAELLKLAAAGGLGSPANERLRFAFGIACAQRAAAGLEDPRAIAVLAQAQSWLAGEGPPADMASLAQEAAQIATSHRGSSSIDGSKHAAVSATFALAKALAGKAIEAADYAAYSVVYSYGGYAVNDPSSFEQEHRWQVQELQRLLQPAAA